MNHLEVIDQYTTLVNSWRLPEGYAVVTGDAACIMLDLREKVHGIDLDLEGAFFDQLVRRGKIRQIKDGVEILLSYGKFTIRRARFLPEEQRYQEKEGVLLYPVQDLIRQKEEMLLDENRSGDQHMDDQKDLAGLKDLVV